MSQKSQLRLWFVDFWRPATETYIRWNGLYRLLSRHWDIVLSPDKPDFLLYSCMGYEHLKYDCMRIFFAGENRRPDFRYCDYSFSFDYPVTERNYRLPLYRIEGSYPSLLQPRQTNVNSVPRQKFCCFLSSNPQAQDRIDFFEVLSGYKQVDSGGSVRNNIGYRITDKMAWLQEYKFNITFENSQHPGYTTEKLPHALLAGTIPIYWGNPLVANDFNPKAFINCHHYSSFNDVLDWVKEVDQNDALYHEYLAQPYFVGGIENDFCREENIVARFNHIFRNGIEFISRGTKAAQKANFVVLKSKQVLKKLFRLVKVLGKYNGNN